MTSMGVGHVEIEMAHNHAWSHVDQIDWLGLVVFIMIISRAASKDDLTKR